MTRANFIPITMATGVSQYKGLTKLRELLKLRIRSLAFYSATSRWIDFLNSTAFYADLARMNPSLVRKIYRAYLSKNLKCTQRVSALIGHYHFILKLSWGPVVIAAARNPLTLAEFSGKSGAVFQLVLQTGALMEREGELVFRLFRDEALVYSCAFSFLQFQKMHIAVGGLQGPPENGLTIIREATKDLYGVRPKHFIVKILTDIGYRLGCDTIQLVSNANHAVIRSRREGKIHAEYDSFWRECGGKLGVDGNFEIVCALLAPPRLAELPSKKRSITSARYHCVANVIDLTMNALARQRKVRN